METKTFRESEIVIAIKASYVKSPIKLDNQEDVQFPNNENLVNKALLLLCDMWNKDLKSRNFVKHLIGNFLPINDWNKVSNFSEEQITDKKDHDCLLGIKLVGIIPLSKALSSISMTKMMIDGKVMTEDRKEYTEAEKTQLQKLRDELPLEIRKASFAYCSPNSDKYLCRESINALLLFTEQCLITEEREVCFLLNKKRINEQQQSLRKDKQLDNKSLNRVVKASTFGMSSMLDDATLEKLKKLSSND